MKKETEDKFNDVFDKYDQKKLEAEKEQQRYKTEHEIFLDTFDKLINSVIRPTMEELSNRIKTRGHHCEITQTSESLQPDMKTLQRASVEMTIYPNSDRASHSQKGHTPTVAFIAELHTSNIYSHICAMMPNRGGHAGKRKGYTVESITRETVEEEVVHLLNECFGR
jgi:hypothetical protein